MLTQHRSQLGLTLIELLVSVVIGVVVLGGTIALFSTALLHSRKTIEASRLNQELQMVLNKITTDVQRAGFWGGAETSSDNPFMVTGSSDIVVNAAGDCILFTYDLGEDYILPEISAQDEDEHFGYRLRDNAIQYRPSTAPFDCAADTTTWINLADSKLVRITQFNASLTSSTIDLDGTGPGIETLTVRALTITLTGELTKDASVSESLTKRIKLYNDKYSS